jgi:hypothetical protein
LADKPEAEQEMSNPHTGLIPIAPGQYDAQINEVASLLVPDGATVAFVQIKVDSAFYTTDGVTEPALSFGMMMEQSETLVLDGAQMLANFRIVSGPNGLMNVEYFKQA